MKRLLVGLAVTLSMALGSQALAAEYDVAKTRSDGIAFKVDPYWPKVLPNKWLLGQVAGVAVDRRDHIWIIQRPGSLTEDEAGAAQTPAALRLLPAGAVGHALRPRRQPARRMGRGGRPGLPEHPLHAGHRL